MKQSTTRIILCLLAIILTFTTKEGLAFMQISETSKPMVNEDEMGMVEPYDTTVFNQKIEDFYRSNVNSQLTERLENAAVFFLDQPYFWEPLGEGAQGKYYQEPLYRTDRFDCVTYVDTVLALSKSHDLNQFKQNILKIRYAGQEISYMQRTDWFTDLEWLPNARNRGWLEDVTDQIIDDKGKPIALVASTIIDKPNWYQVRPMKSLHLSQALPKHEAKQLLLELQSEGKIFKPIPSTLTYLPLAELFNEKGQPNKYLFDQIPSGSVIAIVRPDWQIRDHFEGFPHGYGTNLNVSHLGLALRTHEGLMFYHASSVEKKVVRLPLTEYLKNYLQSPTIKGIHVEKII